MIELLVTYAIVAAAAGWVAWKVLLPSAWRQTIRRTFRPDAGTGPALGCDAGCGSCHCEASSPQPRDLSPAPEQK